MLITDIIFYLLTFVFGLLGFYLFLLTVGSFFYNPFKNDSLQNKNILVLIPCHNEEPCVADTIASLKKCNYPEEYYKVVVIADNCTDHTAKRAKDAGAQVVVRTNDKDKGKGQAIDWFLKNHDKLCSQYDVITLVDGDSLVDSQFLDQISKAFESEQVDVLQAFHGVSNPTDNWRTALMAVAFGVKHHIRPAGRCFLGGASGLYGNGMAFKSDLLLEKGWSAHSIVEDLEFGLQLSLSGKRILYHPKAHVYAKMEKSSSAAKKQRERWEVGTKNISKNYSYSLIKEYFKTRQWSHLDQFIDLNLPPISFYGLGLVILLIWSLVAYSAFSAFFLSLVITLVFTIFSGMLQTRQPLYVWVALGLFPLFVLWRIPLTLNILLGRVKGSWNSTQR